MDIAMHSTRFLLFQSHIPLYNAGKHSRYRDADAPVRHLLQGRSRTMFAMAAFVAVVLASGLGNVTYAASDAPIKLTIQDDHFTPEALHIPADQRVEIQIHNQRAVPAEFESPSISREKVIPGGTTLSLWVGPLKPGEYDFFDEFNAGTKGKLIVTPAQGSGSGS